MSRYTWDNLELPETRVTIVNFEYFLLILSKVWPLFSIISPSILSFQIKSLKDKKIDTCHN